MLILQRKTGESVTIGEDITVTVLGVDGGRARLAINAPKDVLILRSELIKAAAANQDAANEETTPLELLEMIAGHTPAVPPAQPFEQNKKKGKEDSIS